MFPHTSTHLDELTLIPHPSTVLRNAAGHTLELTPNGGFQVENLNNYVSLLSVLTSRVLTYTAPFARTGWRFETLILHGSTNPIVHVWLTVSIRGTLGFESEDFPLGYVDTRNGTTVPECCAWHLMTDLRFRELARVG